jgi:hypothetical protein
LRLLGKLPALYGGRFFDILLLDALYAQAPVLRLAARIGRNVVVSLKQIQHELAVLATSNTREFSRVKHLRLTDWTK